MKKSLFSFLLFLFLSLSLFFLEKKNRLSSFHLFSDALTLPLKKNFFSLKQNFQKKLDFFLVSSNRTKIEDREGELELLNLKLEINTLKKENEILRKQLNVSSNYPRKIILARIIGREDMEIVLDKGEKDGVEKGMPAVLENVLLGKAESVGPSTAKVRLLTHPSFKIPVEVWDKNLAKKKAQGLLSGQFGTGLVLDKVLQSETIEEEGLVVTGSDSEGIPAGFLIGKIKKVKKTEAEIYQTAEVEPLIEYGKLEKVFLVEK